MAVTKLERTQYATFLAKLGFRPRIVCQASLITASQCRKLFDDLASSGSEVSKRHGPSGTPCGILKTKKIVLEASVLMVAYIRNLTANYYENQVDILTYIRSYQDYLAIRRDMPSAFSGDPIDISDGYILAESLRTPDNDYVGVMISCPNCESYFYSAVSQKLLRTECPFCMHEFKETEIH